MAKEYNITKTGGLCTGCEKQLEPGEEYTATVRETDEEFLREDFCDSCWQQQAEDIPGRFGVWKTKVPLPKEKKKVFVDDELLVNFFHRLDGTEDEDRINFRFVLALVLMRKKVLNYEGNRQEQGREVWLMRAKGSSDTYEVVDPHLDEEKIAQVIENLGQILEGEL